MTMPKISATTYILILVVIVFGASIVLGRMFLTREQVALEDKTLQALSQEEERALARVLEERYTKVLPQLGEIRKFMAGSTDNQSLAFIESIEIIARHVGVPLTITYAAAADDMVFVIKAGGAFDRLYRLVSLVETSPYPVVVEALDMQVSGEGKLRTWSLESTLRLIATSTTNSIQ